ncbi:CrpP-related protein [Bordetella petrii]|uniref:CrpP-related protein n=1 Tax=Bordetella petrii TaxID=94624 RepID=UPI002E7AAA97|nr:CrpP-related protein [Bordetella petrii]
MEIWHLGAQAARAGLGLLDCPYYRAASMPAHSGESIRDWQAKVRAWEAGWHSVADARNDGEDGSRPLLPDPPAEPT